jgi:uracil-DNA glycosylase family 4
MDNKSAALQALKEQALQCNLCKLSATRTKVVFGEGSETARIMFIGEGPGKDEDLSGRPFVGRAGELLTRIIENGMKLKRSDVYIANMVKCRPTVDMLFKKDRPPDDEEGKGLQSLPLRSKLPLYRRRLS